MLRIYIIFYIKILPTVCEFLIINIAFDDEKHFSFEDFYTFIYFDVFNIFYIILFGSYIVLIIKN